MAAGDPADGNKTAARVHAGVLAYTHYIHVNDSICCKIASCYQIVYVRSSRKSQ
jgi:hypothetical protein